MTRMSPLERVLLRIEQQDYPMDTMGIYPLDPQADGLPFESVQALFAHRIATVPVLRRQISQTTYGLAEERWMQAAQVDLDHHLRRAVVPAPGNLRALLDLSLRLGQVPLDRRRPLWRAWYVEGLQDGGSALLVRTHHAMVDNLDGLALARHLLDDAPVAVAATPPPEFTGDPSPGALGMLGRAVPGSARTWWPPPDRGSGWCVGSSVRVGVVGRCHHGPPSTGSPADRARRWRSPHSRSTRCTGPAGPIREPRPVTCCWRSPPVRCADTCSAITSSPSGRCEPAFRSPYRDRLRRTIRSP